MKNRPSIKAFVIATLRRASFRWWARGDAMKNYRVDRGRYRCALCSKDKDYGLKEIQLDHVVPVVDPVKGFTTWDDFINRLYCNPEGLQVLCRPHHEEKTEKEKQIRKKYLTRRKKRENLEKRSKKWRVVR